MLLAGFAFVGNQASSCSYNYLLPFLLLIKGKTSKVTQMEMQETHFSGTVRNRQLK